MFSFIKNNFFYHIIKNLNAYEKLLAKVNNIEEEKQKNYLMMISSKYTAL